ncbi:MAG: S41 family peptidase [Verrucomicrobiales bacterium]|nr:S41 family peptidase [Verrucomicrobiales bacterium]
MIRLLCAAMLALGGSLIAEADGPTPEEPSAVEQLPQAAIQSAFRALRQDYIHRDRLTFETLNRAALEGLLQDLGTGAELVRRQGPDAATSSPALQGMPLTQHIGWVRPTAWTTAEVKDLTPTLARWRADGVEDVILDLRQPAEPVDFEIATRWLDLFLPAGEFLFRLRQFGGTQAEQASVSREPAAWEAGLLVLVDADTPPQAEVIAAVLRARQRALVIGSPTRGATVLYQTTALTDEWALRFASSEMLLADGSSLFQKGLTPDFNVSQTEIEKQQAERFMLQGRVRELVHENPRQRFNEAALVSGQNPELGSYLRRSLGQDEPENHPPPRDTILQRAVDLLTARDQLKQAAPRIKPAD